MHCHYCGTDRETQAACAEIDPICCAETLPDTWRAVYTYPDGHVFVPPERFTSHGDACRHAVAGAVYGYAWTVERC